MQHHHHHHHGGHAEAGEPHEVQKWLRRIAIGTALAAGTVIIAPYILPALGVGSSEMLEESILALHATGLGSGAAGSINGLLAAIPVIGETLATNGYVSAAASAAIGIGGVLLGRYMETREDGSRRFRWGKAIKTAALLTSAMIALPSVLTGISTGIVFLSAAFSGAALASEAVAIMTETLGSVGTSSMAVSGLSGAALTVPHLFTCGASIIPATIGLTMFPSSKKKKPISVAATIEPDQPTRAGVPCEAVLRLHDKRTGKPITPSDLATVHTEKIHLFVVDQSLKDYHHIHPVPTDVPGEYRFTFTPNSSNRYTGWADITLCKTQQNYQLKTSLTSAISRHVPPVIKPSDQSVTKGLVAKIKTDEPLTAHAPSVVRVSLSDLEGRPVRDLQPVMGAYAHLVGFTADGNSIIHSHPMGEEPKDRKATGGPDLLFHVEPDQPGSVQFYLQVKRGGEDIYLPFGARVHALEMKNERTQPKHSFTENMNASDALVTR
jgi:hypothetical protein